MDPGSLLPLLALPPGTADGEAMRVILRVVLIGSVIIVLAAGTLLLFFRSFDERRKRADNYRLAWMLALVLAIVMTFCLVLLRLSFAR
jgi:uncharacterized membrane protein YidH (DUF202 family)